MPRSKAVSITSGSSAISRLYFSGSPYLFFSHFSTICTSKSSIYLGTFISSPFYIHGFFLRFVNHIQLQVKEACYPNLVFKLPGCENLFRKVLDEIPKREEGCVIYRLQ